MPSVRSSLHTSQARVTRVVISLHRYSARSLNVRSNEDIFDEHNQVRGNKGKFQLKIISIFMTTELIIFKDSKETILVTRDIKQQL